MLRGTTESASAIVGTAVFRMVVSIDSIRNATATSQGSRRLTEGSGGGTEGLWPGSGACPDLSGHDVHFGIERDLLAVRERDEDGVLEFPADVLRVGDGVRENVPLRL